MGVSPNGGSDGGVRTTGGGDLIILPQEHGHKFHCEKAHYGLVSGSRAASGVKDAQAVMGTIRIRIVRDAEGGWRGGMYEGGGGDR